MVARTKTLGQNTKALPNEMHATKRRLINLGVVLLIIYVLLPQLGEFRQSFKIFRQADSSWLIIGVICAVATYGLAALMYKILAQKPISYLRTLIVEFASAFTNRLLPAGLGGISLNVSYLRRSKHSLAQAGVVVATNNAMGLIGHMVLLVSILLVGADSVTNNVTFTIPRLAYIGFVIAAAAILILVLWLRNLRKAFYKTALGILASAVNYKAHPLRLLGALMCSMALTVFYALALYSCAHSLGINLAFDKVFLIFTLGVGVATITPTPGGLIGAEASLAAGFAAYGVPAVDGIAAALTYRFLTYWLPLGFGFLAFVFAERKKYV